ncbi:MAG: hypothetical protein ACHP7N_14380 [Caulobacterales bacterium]
MKALRLSLALAGGLCLIGASALAGSDPVGVKPPPHKGHVVRGVPVRRHHPPVGVPVRHHNTRKGPIGVSVAGPKGY